MNNPGLEMNNPLEHHEDASAMTAYLIDQNNPESMELRVPTLFF